MNTMNYANKTKITTFDRLLVEIVIIHEYPYNLKWTTLKASGESGERKRVLMGHSVYLDHASTTYTKPEVLKEMLPYFTDLYGNPSSVHRYGREARKALDQARERTAAALNADPNEIYFTGSGTEADNWAVKGAALANRKKGNHIITTSIEHHAVLHTCRYLERNGFEVISGRGQIRTGGCRTGQECHNRSNHSDPL